MVNLTVSLSEISYSQNHQSSDVILLLVSVAFPILDGVLLVPAILILWASGMESLLVLIGCLFLYPHAADDSSRLWFWICHCIGFRYRTKKVLVRDIIYNAGYLSIAAALFWDNRFFVFDEKREQKKWQKKIFR